MYPQYWSLFWCVWLAKIFLPFGRLYLYSGYCFFWCVEVFQLHITLFVESNIISEIYIQCSMVLFWEQLLPSMRLPHVQHNSHVPHCSQIITCPENNMAASLWGILGESQLPVPMLHFCPHLHTQCCSSHFSVTMYRALVSSQQSAWFSPPIVLTAST